MSKSEMGVVDAVPAVEGEKKKKKKKRAAAEAEAAVAEVVVEEPAMKKKKSKKNKEEAPVEAVEEKAEDVEMKDAEEKPKKKKKKSAEVAAETTAAESAAEEEKPKKEKKSKKEKKAVEEEKEEAEEKVEKVEKKEEEKASDEPEQKSVCVAGLSWDCTEEQVKKDFGECGEMEGFRMLMDRETGKPKGICFIDYATSEGVKKCLEYHETEYAGRTLRVNLADNNAKGKGKGKKGDKGKGKRSPGEKPDGCKSVIVKNLGWETTEEKVNEIFAECGNIERCKLLMDRETGSSRGICFIDFDSTEAVDAAIKKLNTEVDGRSIFVDYSGNDGDKGKGKKGDKGKGKKGDGKKGKGKKGKGKKGDSADYAARAKTSGAIQEFAGKQVTIADSDSE